MTRVTLTGLCLLALCAPALAQGKDEKRKVKKAQQLAEQRVRQWFQARSRTRLLVKGSGLRVNERSIRPEAVAGAFLGFAHPAYRAAHQGKEEGFVARLFNHGKPKPNWEGEPLLVAQAKLLAVVVHRDAVTVDANVTFDTRQQESRVTRSVWALADDQLVLSLRPTQKNESTWGPVPSAELVPGFAKSILTAGQMALRVEALCDENKPKELPEKLQKLEMADFGELVAVESQDGKTQATVRAGFLRARVEVPAERAEALKKAVGRRVLFDGIAQAVERAKEPWRTVDDPRGDAPLRWRCVLVDLKGSVTPRED
ncbi:MAG: hypothetical protein AB7N76_00085 [Planctomycetota bacterium]